MKPLSLAFLSLLIVNVASATISVARSQDKPKTLNVAIIAEPFSEAVKSLELYLPRPVEIVAERDPQVTFRAKNVSAEGTLRAIALEAGVIVEVASDRYLIRDAHAPGVTIDVKDEDIHAILKTMQQQCGIKNLVIDPDVQGRGTFLFRDLPCRIAFDTVFRTMGLSSVIYPNSVITVSSKH